MSAVPLQRRLPSCLRASAALALGAALVSPLLMSSPAAAGQDQLYGTRGGEQLSEREHQIELSFARGHATLTVQRTVHNGIERHDEATFWLEIPEGAVATGVRTLGEKDGKPHWYEGELLEAEEAAARYTELTGLGGYYPKDPVLLSWRNPTLLAMQVFPVAPGTDKTVEYTLTMPATWSEGRWHVELPEMGTASMPAELIVDPAEELDQLYVDGEVVGRHRHVELDRPVSLALAPRDPAPVALDFGAVDTGEGRKLVHSRLTLASEFTELAKRAQIVVVLDLSRSHDDAEGHRAAALAYLEHFRDPKLDAEVAVLGFDREIRPIAGLGAGFVDAATAIAALEKAPLEQRNGSEVAAALQEASELLQKQGRARSARRVVLISDFLTASHITPEQARAITAKSGAIVHLAEVDETGRPELWRDDAHAWASVAAVTEGVMWEASVSSDAAARADNLEVFEQWARPTRLDDLHVFIDGYDHAKLADDWALRRQLERGGLAEGEGVELLDLLSQSGRELRVEGKRWNHPVDYRTRRSKAHGDLWSALVFGSALVDELSEPEMMTLAMRGAAVSPVTSYLAIEPGVRPSTEGIEPGERGVGFGAFGAAARRVPAVRMSKAARNFDHQGWLESELGESWARCGGQGPVSVKLETTLDEIVAVELAPSKSAGADLEACMRQSTWSLTLPRDFRNRLQSWRVVIPG